MPTIEFSSQVVQRRIVKHSIGQHPSKAVVQVPEPLKALGLADIHAAILFLPLASVGIADALLAAQIGDGNPRRMRLLNVSDLVVAEPAALDLWSFQGVRGYRNLDQLRGAS